MRIRQLRRIAAMGARGSWVVLLMVTGCAASERGIEPMPGDVHTLSPAEADARASEVRQDPLGYLELVRDECEALDAYTLTFVRHERRGLFNTLHGPETIECWFRQKPFSVRMQWDDPNVKYHHTAYVAGMMGDKVRFITRWWTPPLKPPPNINRVDLQTPVFWGESKRPLTHFGLERLMDRTLESMAEAGENVTLTYEGLLQLPDEGPNVHHFHLEYRETEHEAPIQELYIDITNDLPAGTILKLPSGKIDAAYFYRDIDTDVNLTDEDFLLPGEEPDTDAPDEDSAQATKST